MDGAFHPLVLESPLLVCRVEADYNLAHNLVAIRLLVTGEYPSILCSELKVSSCSFYQHIKLSQNRVTEVHQTLFINICGNKTPKYSGIRVVLKHLYFFKT